MRGGHWSLERLSRILQFPLSLPAGLFYQRPDERTKGILVAYLQRQISRASKQQQVLQFVLEQGLASMTGKITV